MFFILLWPLSMSGAVDRFLYKSYCFFTRVSETVVQNCTVAGLRAPIDNTVIMISILIWLIWLSICMLALVVFWNNYKKGKVAISKKYLYRAIAGYIGIGIFYTFVIMDYFEYFYELGLSRLTNDLLLIIPLMTVFAISSYISVKYLRKHYDFAQNTKVKKAGWLLYYKIYSIILLILFVPSFLMSLSVISEIVMWDYMLRMAIFGVSIVGLIGLAWQKTIYKQWLWKVSLWVTAGLFVYVVVSNLGEVPHINFAQIAFGVAVTATHLSGLYWYGYRRKW